MRARIGSVCIAGWLWLGAAAAQDINTASRAELEQMNGIGVTLAERILVERQRGPFKNWEDFERRVKGVRGARTARLQADGITVNGEHSPRVDKNDARKP